ncbi:MAG: DUF58 domain-containing protein [Gammaproteobacteria bacterium]
MLALAAESRALPRSGVDVTLEAPARAWLGRSSAACMVVRNRGRVRVRVQAFQVLPPRWSGKVRLIDTEVPPRDAQSHEIAATPLELGVGLWGATHVRTLGRFGLAWWEHRLDPMRTVEVVPDFRCERSGHLAGGAAGPAPARVAGAGLELIGLREYTPGDPLRTIDWKASARTGRPQVRIHREEQRLDLLLLLDCGRRSGLPAGEISRLNRYINAAARLAESASALGDAVGILTFADRPLLRARPCAGMAGVRRVGAILGQTRTLEQETSFLPAVLAARHLLQNRALVVILSDPGLGGQSEALADAVRVLVPRHLALIAGIADIDVQNIARQKAVSWRDPFDTLAALELERLREAVHRRAERMGAVVVTAKPDLIDLRLRERYATLRHRRRV